MKKQTLFLFAALLMGITATAQEVSFDLKGEAKLNPRSSTSQFIGNTADRVYFVERTGRMKDHISLAAYSLDLVEQSRVELGREKDFDSYGGFVNGQNIDLLQVSYADNGMHVYRNRRSLSTLSPEGDTLTLAQYSGQKDDEFGFHIATSPNGQLLAGLFMAHRVLQGNEIRVGLYDRQLEEYWSMAVEQATFNAMSVTDEGEIVLYTLGSKGECHFTIVDGENVKHADFSITVKDKALILEKQFVRYGDGKIVMAVTVREENRVIMPQGTNIDAIYIYCYDMAKKHLSVEQHSFTDEENHRLCNTKEGKKPSDRWIPFGEISQTLADKDGGYVIVSDTWTLSMNGMKSQYNRCGIMVMRVDANGKIMWTNTRRYMGSANWNDRDYLTHRWVSTPNGIMLAWVDNIKNINIPNDKEYKSFTPGKNKTVLQVWTLNAAGKESVTYIASGNMCLYGAAHRSGTPGKYIALLNTNRKSQLAFLTIK